ncbi:hypothetical protein [Fibrella aquatilis]|uniref:Uncharacterized protein n=1 Tax=Fibrella aquatilis TaxID=2817059 RepID=A0A939JXK7_9BACT|nr:hypothetical protein [Fibrella aquatilis]MBO0931134.1 hypothetical protein [Fibrella aquatilis]
MRAYLMGLFVDVQGRTQRMRDELRRLPQSLVPAFFMNDTLTMLDRLSAEIDGVIRENAQLYESLLDLGADTANRLMNDYNPGYIATYTRLYQALQRVEFRYTVIVRYGNPEAEFSRFLNRIYGEIGLAKPLPVVSLIRNAQDYYSAHCLHRVIGVPIEEEHHLLNWPDLYHEIGHFVYDEHRTFLLGDGQVVKQVKAHFAAQIDRAGANKKAYWQNLQTSWLDYWLMEFSCDLIATYLTGRAYAWGNFRLSSIIPANENRQPQRHIYTSHLTHPPNEARMRIIVKMLGRCGWTPDELAPLQADWVAYTRLSMNRKPANYAAIVPDALLNLLVDCVLAECPNIKLVGYHEQLRYAPVHTPPVAHLLDMAWQQLLTQPATYSVWEAEQIRLLHATDTPATGG